MAAPSNEEFVCIYESIEGVVSDNESLLLTAFNSVMPLVVAMLNFKRDHVPRIQGFAENIASEMIDSDFLHPFR